MNTPAVPATVALAVRFPATTLPVTADEVSVPVDVMFGCAAVVTVAAKFAISALTKLLPPAPAKIKLPSNCTVAFLVSGVPFMSTTATKSL